MTCEKYRQVCHLMENCNDHGGAWGGVTVVREVQKVLEMSVSFMERCNGNVGGVKGCGEVLQLSVH